MEHGRHGIRFRATMLEMVRKYLWTEQKRVQLYRAIGLTPRKVVVDFGCGTGAFGRVLALGLDRGKGGRLVGIDKNRGLLASARRQSRTAGLSGVTSFRAGDALKETSLPDDFADIVIGQSFLWLFNERDRQAALKEMVRVCKPRGKVAAIEGAVAANVMFVDGHPRLTELWRKSFDAEARGYMKTYGYDRNTGYKLAYHLKRAGLAAVDVKVFPNEELYGNSSVPIEQRREMLNYWESELPGLFLSEVERCEGQAEVRAMVEKAEPMLVAGGMDYEEIIEFNRLKKSRAEILLRNPSRMNEDMSLSVTCGFLATGTKRDR